MARLIVVGSGPAGVAAARRLIALGHRPLVLDGGRRLDGVRAAAVRRMAAVDPRHWDPMDLALVSANATVRHAVPRRLAFGSEFPYAARDPATPLVVDVNRSPVPSLAHGGMSNVWGAASLPIAASDMQDWPIGHGELAPFYRDVLGWVPLVGANDGLEPTFPLYTDDVGALPPPRLAGRLIDRLERRGDLVVGRARLALTVDPLSPDGCRACSRCDVGCVYGSIWNSGRELERLAARGELDYSSGIVVRAVDESGGKVGVSVTDCSSRESRRIEADRLFLAAGAIGSTRIMMQSLEMWDDAVRVRTSRGFGVPLVHVGRGVPPQDGPTLAAAFLEMEDQRDGRWIHTQIGPLNQLVLDKLAASLKPGRLGRRASELAASGCMLALCSLPSVEDGGHLLRLRRVGEETLLEISHVPDPSFPLDVRTTHRRLRSVAASAGFLALGPVGPQRGQPPVSWHVGGSMPMRSAPSGPLDTDRLGRVRAFRRVHIVDSSVFPTVPATTIALPAMANAMRIVDEAMNASSATG